MKRPFRFGVVVSYAHSHTAWIAAARRAGELGYATLLMPDRTTVRQQRGLLGEFAEP